MIIKKTTRSQLTAGQVARHCQVSIPAVRKWIQQGKLVALRTPGRHYRIDINEFQRFLSQHGMPTLPSAEARILIVDDDPDIASLLADFFARDPRGFKLESATDGYEALMKVGAFKPSVLILDVVMPRLDGMEVCRRLKANSETRSITILGITGYPHMIPAVLEAGADACLTKPLELGRVRQEVDRLLASHPLSLQSPFREIGSTARATQ